MLQTAHDNSRQRFDLIGLLVERLGAADSAVQDLLILETVDIIRSMRVDVLQAASELIVQTVNEADDGTANAHNSARVCRSSLSKFIIVLGSLLNGVLGVGGHDRDELIDLTLSREPKLSGHVRCNSGIVVETRGDEGEEDTDALVGGCGDFQELLEDPDLLGAVSVLLSKISKTSNITGKAGQIARTFFPLAS